MNFVKNYYLYICFVILGFAFGAWYFGAFAPAKIANQVKEAGCQYRLINPLRCDGEAPDQVEYSVFKKTLQEKQAREIKAGRLSEASVYFRDLNNGPTFYFDEQAEFAPMSLLKLPVMIAVYKYAETHPEALQEKLRTPSSFAQNSQIMEKGKTLQPDTEYTVDEVVRYMIVYSDNRGIDMLGNWLDAHGDNHEIIRRTLSDLGLVGYEANLSDAKITVKQYASLFRILYNASYLSPAMSEKALDILAQTEFKDGLVGKLPATVKVAHKFGVRAYVEGEQQLHDCGIVYFEPTPYMICIMTRGQDYARLSEYIKTTSKEIFDEVNRRSR